MTTSPYHEGEQALQTRLGVRDRIEKIGARAIHDFMPNEHREFFAQLPWLLVGSRDTSGQPWASALTGEPGFVTSPDSRTLSISATPPAGDALSKNLRLDAPVGVLGIELPTRRRNRMNGRIASLGDAYIAIHVDQSYGNCPKYINRKLFEPRTPTSLPTSALTTQRLNPRQRAVVTAADMLFIASSYVPNADRARSHGVDVSHRGGRPGFVRIETDGALTIPDYVGNFLFNTLGNIEMDGRCGLLFIDFDSGDELQLTGTARIDWDAPEVETKAGVQRLLRVEPTELRLLSNAFGYRAVDIDGSPNLDTIDSIVPVKSTVSR